MNYLPGESTDEFMLRKLKIEKKNCKDSIKKLAKYILTMYPVFPEYILETEDLEYICECCTQIYYKRARLRDIAKRIVEQEHSVTSRKFYDSDISKELQVIERKNLI